jgi:hypothetical protein
MFENGWPDQPVLLAYIVLFVSFNPKFILTATKLT